MRTKKTVPDAVTRRLPRYYRHLGDLLEAGRDRISSKELSEKMGVTASQIRQDLNHFGGFGQQGYGYNVAHLHGEIGKILGITRDYSMIVVGAGNMGRAIAKHTNFEKAGFCVRALFDINPKRIGLSVRGIEVRDTATLKDYLKTDKTDIAVIATPASVAGEVADFLVKNGVKYIWNFAPADITATGDVIVENVHLTDSLITLAYRLNERETDK